MLRLFGPVQQLHAASEPSYTGDLAVDTSINYGRNSYCGPFGHAMPHTNVAIFILLFTVCAIEVLVVKIVTALRDGIEQRVDVNHNHEFDPRQPISSSSNSIISRQRNNLRISVSRIAQIFSFDNRNNNNHSARPFSSSVHRDAWNWIMALHQAIQQPQRRDSLPQQLIPTHTFLERIARATEEPFPDDNNNYQ